MIKAALIGCGNISDVHAKALAGEPGVSFTACCDVDMSRALKTAYTYDLKAYSNLRELIATERPDVINIATPHYTHVPLAAYALRRGVNVLLEKPAASTPLDINALRRAAEESGAQLGLCFQNRYNASSRYVKALLESGECGRVLSARGFVCWSRDDGYYKNSDWRGALNTEGTSAMINQGIHTLDLLQWFLGDPLEVYGHVSNRDHAGVINTEDTAEACLYYAGGVRALFYISVAYGINAPVFLEIACENCVIQIIGDGCRVVDGDGKALEPTLESGEKHGKSYWGSGHKALISDFCRHIEEKRPFPIDAAEGCRALKTCFMIVESSLRGERVAY